MQINFYPPKTSTASYNGKINLKSDDRLDLLEFVKQLKLSDTLPFAVYRKKKLIVKMGESIKKPKKNQKKTPKYFNNCCKLELVINEHVIDAKIHSNGKIVCSGLRSISFKDAIFEQLNLILHDYNTDLVAMPLRCSFLVKTTKVTDKHLRLNLRKLFKFIDGLKNPNLICVFENIKGARLSIYYSCLEHGTSVTYLIFGTGSIIMTGEGFSNTQHENYWYDFITKLLINNIEKFLLIDSIEQAIQLIEKKTCPQKSEEWLNLRKNYITASESQYILLDEPLYGSIDEYIFEKANRMNGIRTFKGNYATRHGELFEPIAQEYYICAKNNDSSSKTKIILYETGFHTQDSYMIGASPDGIILKYLKPKTTSRSTSHLTSRDYTRKSNEFNLPDLPDYYQNFKPSLDYQELADRNSLRLLTYKNKIIDAYLIEIKCPVRWKPVLNSVKDDRPNYYCQIQTQLYVTNLTHCIFFDVRFETFDSYDEFILVDKGHRWSGLVYVVIIDDGKLVNLYPNIVNTHAENELNKQLYHISTNHKIIEVKKKYWILMEHRDKLVTFDKKWYKSKLDSFISTRKDILAMKDRNIM